MNVSKHCWISRLFYNLSTGLLFAAICALVVLVTSCNEDSTGPGSNEFNIQVTSTQSHGEVLADGEGNVLYYFTPDVEGESACEGACIGNWPVFHVEQPQLGAGLNAEDFGSITRSDGSSQTTFAGWPLYYFAGDDQPGTVNGDGAGGIWYVAKPNYSLVLADQQLVGNDGSNYRVDDSGNYVEGDDQTSHIVDIEGRTLYIFTFDSANTNNYTDEDFGNDGAWPIFHVDIDALPSGIDESNFGEITVHGERQQLTYKGWPIYYFGQDEMQRGNTRGVSVPQPGIWPVVQTDMEAAPGFNSGNDNDEDSDPGY